MKITRLQKAKNYRIFRDFNWPTSGLPDFARFNVVYGWNGTGKTSLSNVFRMVQRRQSLTEGAVEINVGHTRVSGGDFGTAALPSVRTFNRDAVDRSVFEVPNRQLPPVFFLGEDSVEKQRRIEELSKDLVDKVASESLWDRKKVEASSALETICSEEAKGIKNLLTVAGGGPFNNYNAANFKAEVQELVKRSPLPPQLTDEQRQVHLATKDGKALERVVEPKIQFPDVVGLTSRTKEMLRRSVVLAVLSDLVDNPSVASWVNTGLGLHRGQHLTTNCRFCDQPLPERRIQQLEAHFNNEFKRFVSDVDSLVAEIQAAQEFPKVLRVPPKEALYANLRPAYEKAMGTLTQQAGTVPMALDVLLRALKSKRDEPFKVFDLAHFITNATAEGSPAGGIEVFFQIVIAGISAVGAAIGKAAFDHLTEIIKQHNQHTDTFDDEVKRARFALAQHEVLRALPKWQKKSKAVTEARDQANAAREAVGKLKTQIAELELEVLQHRRPAEELNQEVAAYLGRDELRFEVEKNGYRIMRGGHPAMHLSDGERTAIAFLYFLKSLKATDFDLGTGIVVIDDPVSSLDANSLFSAFGFLKQRTAEAGQLFILTHNFTFFRQVRNWYYNLPNQKKKDVSQQPARFYMLATEFVGGVRTARLDSLDPFLHQYESEYHYLFKRVHEEANKAVVPRLENYYAIPNIARRLLEAFLAFRIPDKPGELFQKLECIEYDTAKKTRILRFLHTYSHFDQVAEPDHDPSVLSETPAILQELLEFIRHCDPNHYERMAALVSAVS
ncbi:AAA family ATPase [Leptothrix ochracea]|uniref:AAA family ATPase n=1 Tax=Leptothrix ochracea TaxID=735331 RepID=UPI0034E19488